LLKQAKLVIVACVDPKKSGSRNGADHYRVAVEISMEHIVLPTTDPCLGTCWIRVFDATNIQKSWNSIESQGYCVDHGRLMPNGAMSKMLTKLIVRTKRKLTEKDVPCEKW